MPGMTDRERLFDFLTDQTYPAGEKVRILEGMIYRTINVADGTHVCSRQRVMKALVAGLNATTECVRCGHDSAGCQVFGCSGTGSCCMCNIDGGK